MLANTSRGPDAVYDISFMLQEIGVLANTSGTPNSVNTLIDLGAESTSFWSRSGPGCRVNCISK